MGYQDINGNKLIPDWQLAMNDQAPGAQLSLTPAMPKTQNASPPPGVSSPPLVPSGDKPSPPTPDLSQFMVTKDDLQNAADAKRRALLIGSIGDALANRQSFGNFFLGKPSPHNDVMGTAKQYADLADEPIKQKQMLLKQETERPQLEYAMKLQDPNSNESRLSKTLALSALDKLELPSEQKLQLAGAIKNANGYQVHQMIDENPLLKEIFSSTIAGKKLAATVAGITARTEQGQQNIDIKRDRIDRAAHQQILNKLAADKQLGQRLSQYQNLDNALSNIAKADVVGPNQIHEFQQAVRGNMGIKGTGGVGERAETYFNSLGLKGAEWKQFITGNPVALSKDSNLMNHLKNLAYVEQQNIYGQMDKRLKAISGGQSSMYARRPDLKGDLDEAIRGYQAQTEAPGAGKAPSGPNPGDIEDGHRFKGGDPADPKNWEAVK